MEANSQISCLEEQLREYYGRVVWTHKTHEKQADIYARYDNCLKCLQIVLSAMITSGIAISIFKTVSIIAIVTALISLTHVIITTYMKNKDYGQIAQLHAITAIQVWKTRESLLSLLTDMKDQRVSPEEAQTARDELHEQLYCVYEKAPRTSAKAYKKASEALKDSEELYFSVEEIDLLLPKSLRVKG